VRHKSVDEDPRSTFYLPAAQASQRLIDALVVRTTADPRDRIAAIRRIIARTDPTLAIERADRLVDLVDASRVAERFRTLLFVFFAATAVVLAGIGIVGVATNAVATRRRELAIRMAVGALPATVIRDIVSGTLAVAVAGTLVGVSIALAATRALRPFLYGVSSADPATYLTVVGLIVSVAAVAAFVPARRATTIDLMRVLSGDS
jgi:ABC-type antimicrobial peptide transport system permease subunit